ncbi:resuscitation-promoting factor [Streptomyces sp. RKAG293]|uniref:ubiquitin-like domain-containing protein n=1 Tax=Streptomyces sp. RKAG293 TaxID=2893403 RepID=UPI002033BD5B|nr:resuscitation-promoting factor [Streptomyces sp. RKAG293]MCM2419807.1 ubiquitin-like domain-containing protein [Streptomyces sp. RKAG293]
MSNAQGTHRAARGAATPVPGAATEAGGTRLPHQSDWDAVPNSSWADEAAATGCLPVIPVIPEQEPAPTAAPVGARTAARRAARSGGRAEPASTPSPAGGSRRDPRRDSRRDLRPDLRPDSLRKLLPQALVVAFLAGGTVAFLAGDKDVQLTVDGEPRTLHTFADDVGEVLAQQGVTVGEHDLVAPGPQAELHDGDQVEVRFGRPVTLTLDGHRRLLWTTADTVDEALRELGVRAEGAHLSASRGSSIGRHGLDLDVRTERTVTLLADGRERTVRTNAATVREVVAQSGITLRNQDATSVDPESFPREGQTISVLRISGTEEVREEPVRFRTEKHKDAQLFHGTEAVDTPGKAGVRRVTYAFRTVNGVKQRPRIIRSEIVREPVTQVVRIGTKPLPTSVAGADGLNWQGLAHCEAGGRPHAVDPSGTYGGLYQFDTQTWHSLGGSGRPQDAPAGEQTFRAKRLYIQRGSSPWPVCGRKLGG